MIIGRYPEYEMDDRISLETVDFDGGVVVLEGKAEYPMLDLSFPMVGLGRSV